MNKIISAAAHNSISTGSDQPGVGQARYTNIFIHEVSVSYAICPRSRDRFYIIVSYYVYGSRLLGHTVYCSYTYYWGVNSRVADPDILVGSESGFQNIVGSSSESRSDLNPKDQNPSKIELFFRFFFQSYNKVFFYQLYGFFWKKKGED